MKRSRLFTWSLFLAVAPVLGTSASAQETPIPLDTVSVEVASRAGQLLGSTTRAVEVIDRETIDRTPALNVVEVLQWAFGVELMPRSPALVDIGIRGSSFEQVLVLVDGIRMRDGQTGHFNLNLAVPLDQVERVEVLRGPAASLYGSDALAGVVNIVTRKSGQATSASVAGGSFDRRSAAVSHRQVMRGVTADLAGAVERSDGHRPGTDYDLTTARAVVEIPAGAHEVTAEVAHAIRDFGADGFYGAYPSFESTRTTTAVLRSRIRPAGRLLLDPSLRLRRNADDFILFRDEPERYRNRHTSLQVGTDVIGRVEVSERVRAAVGVHAYRDEIDSRAADGSSRAALGEHSEFTVAASTEITAHQPGLGIGTFGLRADRVPSGDMIITPGASFSVWPSGWLRLRSSIGRAFRSPTWTERFYRDPVNEGSADLNSERAWSADVGFDIHPLRDVRLTGSAFLRDAADLIDWAKPADDSDPVWRTRNVAEARFEGLEAEIELAQLAGARIRARGSWISLTSSAAPGFTSKYALRPQVESLSLFAERDILGLLQLSARGARERRRDEEHYYRVDTRAALRLGEARIYLDLQNALDAEYLDISQHRAAGRNVVLGLELRSWVR